MQKVLSGENKESLKVIVNDPYDEIIKRNIAKHWPVHAGALFVENNIIKSIAEKSISLKEVTIESAKGLEKIGFYEKLIIGPNPCGDYVCPYGVLNCPYHSAATSPIKGKTYPVVNKINKEGYDVVQYKGCLVIKRDDISLFKLLPTLYTNKEFYVNEYKNNQETALSSTLYWGHYNKVQKNKALDLTFYTSDVKSNFKVVLQGLADGQPVFNQYDLINTNK